MKTSLCNISLTVIATVLIPVMTSRTAQAATFEPTPFETLTVDSTTPLTKVFSSSLENAVLYKFEASGQYTPDFNLQNWSVDARFVSRDNFSTQNDLDPNFSDFDFGLFSDALGSSNDDFWGDYQPSHIYSFEFLGTGSPVDFYVNDTNTGSGADNAGTFTISIFREQVTSVPEPSPLLSTLGLIGISLLAAIRKKNNQSS